MQCPKCQHEMIESRNGWLCLSCGHLEPNAHTKPLVAEAAKPAIIKESVKVSSKPVGDDQKDESKAAPVVEEGVKETEAARPSAEPVVADTPVVAEAAEVAPDDPSTDSVKEPDPLEVAVTPPEEEAPADDAAANAEAKQALAEVQAAVAEATAAAGGVASEPESALPSAPKVSAASPVMKVPAADAAVSQPAPVHANEIHAGPTKAMDAISAKPEIEPAAEAPAAEVEVASGPSSLTQPSAEEAAPESATLAPVADSAPSADQPVPEAPEAPAEAVTPQVPVTDSAPIAPAPVAQTVPAGPLAAKAPIMAATHPHPVSGRDITLIITGVLLLLGLAGWAFVTLTGMKLGAAQPPATVGKLLSSPAVLPAETEATPGPEAAAARDAQRQTTLLAYAEAYRARADNGFYPVTPPAVTVTSVDPSNQAAYSIAIGMPTDLGVIGYQPGGRCAGPDMTPGKTATRYVAVRIQLETNSTPACVAL